jgi:23S rRNA pseudouridine1911/1915/1917 synthase
MGTGHEGGGRIRRLEVAAASDATRLDTWLAEQLPELSRSRAAQLIAAGNVRVGGQAVKKSHRPEPGEIVEIEIPPVVAATAEAEELPLSIVWEDDDSVVVNKPAGLVVHPAPGHPRGTLVNALLHSVSGLSGIGGVAQPGIVHRLDRDTSGLLLVAKHDEAHRRLSAALKRREIRRRYLAACWGHLRQDEVTVDAPIGRSPSNRKRMAVVAGGRAARTRFVRLERWVAADLLRVELESGRTHQIRVHLASIGHAVVADSVYGERAERGMSGRFEPWAREFARRVPRQFLHAAELEFEHPMTRRRLSFEAELPRDLEAAAEWAREHARG